MCVCFCVISAQRIDVVSSEKFEKKQENIKLAAGEIHRIRVWSEIVFRAKSVAREKRSVKKKMDETTWMFCKINVYCLAFDDFSLFRVAPAILPVRHRELNNDLCRWNVFFLEKPDSR